MSKESTKFAKDNKKYILVFGIKKMYEINTCYYSTQQGVHCYKQIIWNMKPNVTQPCTTLNKIYNSRYNDISSFFASNIPFKVYHVPWIDMVMRRHWNERNYFYHTTWPS